LHGDGNIFYIVELIKSSPYNLILFFPQVKQATISSVLSNEPASVYYLSTPIAGFLLITSQLFSGRVIVRLGFGSSRTVNIEH
jgi:hypothetical protein